MIIGLIGFGKVSQNLLKLIKSDNITFITSKENRSAGTMEKIDDAEIEVLDTFREVAEKSDILISANSPKQALEVAQKYAKLTGGIFVDLNNVSPDTTQKISELADDFVDAAIIGKIDSPNPVLYLSGKSAFKLKFLDEFIKTVIISDKIGDASILKMLRSTYTKTLSAVLIESYELSKKYGLENEFFDTLSLTEGDEFREKSLSRIQNTCGSSKRKSEELEEIIDYFDDDLIMVEAALEKLRRY